MDPKELPLRDIHLPDSVSWWPIASGWWLILVMLVVVAMVVWAIRQAKSRLQLRKQALLELDKIRNDFDQHQDLSRLASDCSILLRRVALSHYPRHDVAGLTGTSWIAFLNEQRDNAEFDTNLGDALTQAPYRTHCDFDANALLAACRRWLERLPPQQGGAA